MEYLSYYVLKIQNKEPMKIGANGSKENQTEPSKEYIPGSTLRGTFISRMLKGKDIEDKLKYKMLSNIDFYNAYPYAYDNGKEILFMPAPRHIRIDKHQWRRSKHSENRCKTNNLLEESTDDKVGKNNLEFRFIGLKGEQMVGFKTKKTYRLHHNTKKELGSDERDNLFRYEAIDKGHCFKGMIHVKDEELRQYVEECLKEREFWIGGSKSSGYGKVELIEVEENTRLETGFKRDKNIDAEIRITCLSDCIFRDRRGNTIGKIEESELEPYFGKSLFKRGFIDTGISEGYNNTWKSRYPKETTVKAGSVLVYEVKNCSEEKIKEFEEKLHGERTQDGFGWVAVNLEYGTELDTKNLDFMSAAKVCIQEDNREEDKVEEDKSMKIILKGMSKSRKNWIRSIVKKEMESNKTNDSRKRIVVDRVILSKENCRNMMAMISYVQKSIEVENETKNESGFEAEKEYINSRSYTQDNTWFSVVDQNFKNLFNYLSGHKNEHFSAYAKEKLNSAKGKLLYSGFLDEEIKKRMIISEIAYEALYIKSMEEVKASEGGVENGE